MPIRLDLGERPHEADSGERSVAGATRDARGATRDWARQSDSERPQSLVISDPVCRGSASRSMHDGAPAGPSRRPQETICNNKIRNRTYYRYAATGGYALTPILLNSLLAPPPEAQTGAVLCVCGGGDLHCISWLLHI